MAPARHPLRNWVLGMYRSGVLVSPSDGAEIASVPRQTVSRWLREGGVDVKLAHQAFIARQHVRAQRYLDGKLPGRNLTKRHLRKIAAKALRNWNYANGKSLAGHP